MILQKFLFDLRNKDTDRLYVDYSGTVQKSDDIVFMSQGAKLDLKTYFNCFAAGKWRKYTKISTIRCEFLLSGKAEICVYSLAHDREKVNKKLLCSQTVDLKEAGRTQTRSIAISEGDVFAVEIKAEEGGACLYEGTWITDDEIAQNEVNLGIGICTFKREAYVERNMNQLKAEILENEKALSYGHVQVCISDNAGTLVHDKIASPSIQVVNNKNLGGVGGFTRDMLELMENPSITHVLLMDDDAVIAPGAVEKTYMFLSALKEEYKDYIVGGGLLRQDRPVLQYEAGAMWNDGDIAAHNHDMDMTQLENVICNEKERVTEYAGWWYSCIPVSFIKDKQLPLPLFIHRDDIEYGLRAEGKFIFLNGICVWHEAFENKLPGFLEYYDVRNLAITNAIHNKNYTAKQFKKMLFIQVSSNIGKYRYRYVDLNLKGAVDFLKGFQWFYRLDTLEYHKSLAKYNYQAVDAGEFVGYHGMTEEDLQPCQTEEDERPSAIIRLIKMMTFNGHFLPARKESVRVVRPNPNIYDLFRMKEVIYVDSNGKAVHVKRNLGEFFEAYIKLYKVFRLIDKHYERACKEFLENHKKIQSHEFWREYLLNDM